MADLLDRLLSLWLEPPTDGAEAAFAQVYADPVIVNGAEMPVAALVARARSLHGALDDVRIELLDQVETPDRIAIAFVMRGRHVGPLDSPLGIVEPTRRDVEVRTIDVLTVDNDLITRIWVVADELGQLTQLGAVRLA